MKNIVFIAIAVGLVIALGVQTYMVFELNNKVNQLTQQTNQGDHAQIKKPKIIPPGLPQSKLDEDIFSDQNWNPYEEMQRMQNEMQQVFGDSFSRFHLNSPSGGYSKVPDLDLQEKSDSYIATLNVPGADESSLNVKLDGQVLHISMKTEHTEDTDNAGFKHRERFSGEFNRVLTLPKPVESDKMKTDYHNGVLTITIPKKTEKVKV